MDDIGEAVILDADNNTVKTPFDDAETLPDEVLINLKRNLKSSNNMLGDSVARAFLRALVQLIGNYKEALQFREEDKIITFNKEKFVSIRPPNFQPFAEKMLDLQIFQQVREISASSSEKVVDQMFHEFGYEEIDGSEILQDLSAPCIL